MELCLFSFSGVRERAQESECVLSTESSIFKNNVFKLKTEDLFGVCF